jgi:hypothetical protein
LIKKETENIVKYKDLAKQNILNVKREVVTRNKETSGTISLSFRKYLHIIPGNPPQSCDLTRVSPRYVRESV